LYFEVFAFMMWFGFWSFWYRGFEGQDLTGQDLATLKHEVFIDFQKMALVSVRKN
jgi:hypothetical protein